MFCVSLRNWFNCKYTCLSDQLPILNIALCFWNQNILWKNLLKWHNIKFWSNKKFLFLYNTTLRLFTYFAWDASNGGGTEDFSQWVYIASWGGDWAVTPQYNILNVASPSVLQCMEEHWERGYHIHFTSINKNLYFDHYFMTLWS